MDFSDFMETMTKAASQQPQPSRGQQAMAAAAQIAVKPIGSAASIKPIEEPQQDQGNGVDLQKQLDDKDREIKKLERENQIAQQNLDFQKLENEKLKSIQQVRDEERRSRERLQTMQEALEKRKVMADAEEVRHQSTLQQNEAASMAKVQQEKNKALMDLNNQGMKMQMAASDRARAAVERYKDEARKQSDKIKEDARKQIDSERMAMQREQQKVLQERMRLESQLEAQKSQASFQAKAQAPQVASMSPALKHLMGSAVKSMSKFRGQAVELPAQGADPAYARMKMAAYGNGGFYTGNQFGVDVTAPPPLQRSGAPQADNPYGPPPQEYTDRSHNQWRSSDWVSIANPMFKGLTGYNLVHTPNTQTIYASNDKLFQPVEAAKTYMDGTNDPRLTGMNRGLREQARRSNAGQILHQQTMMGNGGYRFDGVPVIG